jgi:mannitol/fructose-specific phosphotransferase system IIA component (Ntr-type)
MPTTTVRGLIDPQSIVLELAAPGRDAAILELARRLEAVGAVDAAALVTEAALEREALGSTNIGFGVAIPHAKSAHVRRAALAFGRRNAGVEWPGEAVEDAGAAAGTELAVHPVHLIFLIASPEHASDDHLRMLAALARALMHEDFRDALRTTTTADAVLELLEKRLTIVA